MQIVVQTAHVSGDPFGAMTIINILRNEHNASMFTTAPATHGAGWQTDVHPLELDQLRQLVDALSSERQRVVTSARDTDDPSDYMIVYYVSGHILGQLLDFRVEQVVTSRRPQYTSRAYDAITSFLKLPTAVA